MRGWVAWLQDWVIPAPILLIIKRKQMKEKIKKVAKKSLLVLPWIVLLAVGVYFASGWLSDAIVKEFVEPFLK